jgi:hypothetical protein
LDVGERPLLDNLRKSLIDPDTPKEAFTKKNVNGKEMKLVVGIFDKVMQNRLLTLVAVFGRIQRARSNFL